MSDTIDRYPTTHRATCPVCNWQYSVTNGVPAECPACERAKRMDALMKTLNKEAKK